jgi:hypothetical protein
MLGEYHDDCFVFGRISDMEFSMNREPIEINCDDEAALNVWQMGHGFKSEWIVTN